MSNDVYKLELVKNIIINIKDISNSQIYCRNYQTYNFSTSCVLSMKYMMNELGIAANLKI